MGGQVSVKSKLNVGSTFSITVSTKIRLQIQKNKNHKKVFNSNKNLDCF